MKTSIKNSLINSTYHFRDVIGVSHSLQRRRLLRALDELKAVVLINVKVGWFVGSQHTWRGSLSFLLLTYETYRVVYI